MRTRTVLTRLTILTALLLLLAACGGGGQAGSTAPAAPAGGQAAAPSGGQAAAPTAGAAGGQAAGSTTSANVDANGKFKTPQTIEVMATVRSSELAPPGADWIVAKAVKDQLNIDLKMTWVTQSNEYDRLLQTRAAANDLPDVFLASPTVVSNLAPQGLLADWTPYLKFMPTFVPDREVEKLKPIGTFDGKLLALVTKTPDPYKQSVMIRKDWLDKLGLQAPKTLDEYLAVMKAFTEKDPDGNGQKDTFGWSAAVDTATGRLLRFDPIFGAFGAEFDTNYPWRVDNNKLVYVPTSNERKDALQYIAQMNAAGVIDADWKAQKDEDFRNKWKAGKIGIWYEDWCAGFCSGNHDPFAKANPTGRTIDIDPPVGSGGKSAVSFWTRLNAARFGMSTKAEKAGKGEAIARFLEWLNGPGYLLTTFGEEGKMWKREGDKITVDQANDFRIVRALSAWSVKGSEEELRSRYDQTTSYPNGENIAVWDILQRAQKIAKVDTTDLAVLPPAPSAQAADITRLQAEGEFQFVTGQRPFSQWDAYVQSLKAAGVDAWQQAAEAKAKEAGLIK